MYHIKDDKRMRKSAELLCEALMTCLKSKPFAKITITDLQQASSVSRATFYRLFDNTTDIFYYQCERLFQNFLTEYGQANNGEVTIRDKCITFFDYLITKGPFLADIVAAGKVEVVYNCHRKYGDRIVTYFFSDAEVNPAYIEFINVIFPSLVISFYSDALGNQRPKNGVLFFEMVQKITRLMSDTFLTDAI